ncbi:MAG: very short patch repair endonuclease [Oscillospiraceae bacterium]|jgi:DNA mismatch endonuclease (patch repair protein)|nr:very short patch repair endonuclease [Oscillospiraceae bacterium]
MTDIFTKDKRCEIMRKIKSFNNKSTELKLIEIFKGNNVKGWRRGYKIEGKPDFVFKRNKIAVFVDGCFWHGHNCRNTNPKDNSQYWTTKITRNQKGDLEVSENLKKKKWQVVRIWECDLKNKSRLKLMKKLEPIVRIQSVKKN